MTKELFFFPLALLLVCLLFPLQLFPFCYIVLQKIKHFRCWWLGLCVSFWPFQFWGTASFSLFGITAIWIQSFMQIRSWRPCRGWGGTTSRSVECKDGLYSWVVSHAVFHLFVERPGFFSPFRSYFCCLQFPFASTLNSYISESTDIQ